MCGISGFIGLNDKALLARMSEKLRHRGPDEKGCFTDKAVGLAIRRLSILDPLKGKQPMSNEEGTLHIVYNGELFNFPELKKKLVKLGHNFKTNCDTEAVLHAFEEYGEACLKKLDGQFAFAIWNGKTLFMARDYLGIMPLYYCFSEDKNALLFASELKSLLEYEDSLRQTWNVSLEQYFECSDWTPFTGIFHLLPGHSIKAEIVKAKLKIVKERYYKIPETIRKRSESQAIKKVHDLTEQGIKSQLISDVPLGVLLSGGLDSSIVAMVASKEIPNLKTFSIGTANENEFPLARMVSEKIGSEHKETILDEKAVAKSLPSIIYHLENYNPRIVQTSIPNFNVVKLASKQVKVLLCGEGSDELFCGYRKWFFPLYYENEKCREEREKSLQREVSRHTSNLFQQNLLRVDRIAMAHSVESRVPLLNYKLFNYSMQLNPSLKLKNQTEKYILRKAFAKSLSQKIVWQRKQYFSIGAGVPTLLKKLFNISKPEEKHAFYKEIFDKIFVDNKQPQTVKV